MSKNNIGSVLLATAILCVICTAVFIDRADEHKHAQRKELKITIDSIYRIDDAAEIAMQNLKIVDSILQQDKLKEQILLRESKRIKDSISLAQKRMQELNQKAALEKRLLKEKYENHINDIYKVNCIQRGGPEDTIANY